MAVPNLALLDGPIGPLRDKHTVDISANDFVHEAGFICQAATAGDLTYQTLTGEVDQTEAGLAIGDTVSGPGGIPVLLKAVRASSTVTSIIVGIV